MDALQKWIGSLLWQLRAVMPTPISGQAPEENESIAVELREYLLKHHVRGPLAIEIVGDTIVLRGRVGSFYKRQVLVHGARRVAGLWHVVDEFDVAPWHAK